MSPELLDDPKRFGLKKSCLTKESDRYALGMVVYETLSGQIPFAKVPLPAVILKVLDGDRPARPRGLRGVWFRDGIWEMLELCWKPQPHERPGLDTILQCLKGAPRPPRTPPDTDGDVEPNFHGQPDASRSTVNDPSPFPQFGLTSHAHIQSSLRHDRLVN